VSPLLPSRRALKLYDSTAMVLIFTSEWYVSYRCQPPSAHCSLRWTQLSASNRCDRELNAEPLPVARQSNGRVQTNPYTAVIFCKRLGVRIDLCTPDGALRVCRGHGRSADVRVRDAFSLPFSALTSRTAPSCI
jgi:hypothetical protein